MYGNETAIGTAGGTLAVTGISTGSMVLAFVASTMIVSGLVLMLVRGRRLKGQRP